MGSGLIIAKASAGSGKTFSLVHHYLLLALENPEAFDRILGITFTNKAAAEMKLRALSEVGKIAGGKDSPHIPGLLKELRLNSAELRERARTLERLMLHRFYRIRFSTIDALLQTLLRHMAHELGLSASYALETDTESIKKELLRLFYLSLADDEQTRLWLMDYVEERLKDKKSWDLEAEVARFVEVLFQENSREIFGKHWPHVDKARRFKERLMQELESLWQPWATQSEAITEKLSQYGLSLDIFSSREKFFIPLKLLAENSSNLKTFLLNWNKFQPKAEQLYFWSPQELSPKKSGIKAAEKARFQEALNDGLGILFEQWHQSILKDYPRFKTLYLISRTLYHYGLLGKFSALFDDWRATTHTQLIQDAPRILAELLETGDADFIYEKTSQRFQHILLDEFQDTSQAQWRSLQPLVRESLASGNLVYAVGDPKQSIYAWRGAAASIMQYDLPQSAGQLGLKPAVEILSVNRRSAPQIVSFNNRLFRFLADYAPGYLRDYLGIHGPSKSFEEAVKDLHETYQNLEQTPAHEQDGLSGKIEVVWIEPQDVKKSAGTEDVNGSQEPNGNHGLVSYAEDDLDLHGIKEKVLSEVLNRWVDEGINPGDIVVLVRSNQEVDAHVMMLNRLINRGALCFKDARAVSSALWNPENSKLASFCLAFLNYVADPTQLFHKAMLFYRGLLLQGVSPSLASARLAHTEEIEAFVSTLKRPAGATTACLRYWAEEYLPRFRAEEKEKELAYILRLIDLAAEFEKKYPGTPGGFLNWLQEAKPNDWTDLNRQENLIRVATIHSVKGLEFESVVLSLSPSSAFENHREVVWYPVIDEVTQNVPEYFPFRRIPGQHKAAITEEEFFKDCVKQLGEAMNILYVGCTRAKRKLCLLLPKGRRHPTKTSWYDILLAIKETHPKAWEANWKPLEDAGALVWETKTY